MPSTSPLPPRRTSAIHLSRRFGITVATVTAAAAVAAGSVAPAAAAPTAPTASVAGSCIHQVFGLIPSSRPWQDMSLGFSTAAPTTRPWVCGTPRR